MNATGPYWWQVNIGAANGLKMAWCRQATSHYLKQCWPRSPSPYGVTMPQWVNSSWPNWPSNCDFIGCYISWSALIQIMACCLMAPSHYLNQCRLITSEVLWHSTESHSAWNTEDICPWYEFENDYFKFTAKSPKGHWVDWWFQTSQPVVALIRYPSVIEITAGLRTETIKMKPDQKKVPSKLVQNKIF